jgi:hypothetical protein
VTARVLSPRELAQHLRDGGLAAGPLAALVGVPVPAGMEPARGLLTPKRPRVGPLPACFGIGVLGIVRGPTLATVVVAAWRNA